MASLNRVYLFMFKHISNFTLHLNSSQILKYWQLQTLILKFKISFNNTDSGQEIFQYQILSNFHLIHFYEYTST